MIDIIQFSKVLLLYRNSAILAARFDILSRKCERWLPTSIPVTSMAGQTSAASWQPTRCLSQCREIDRSAPKPEPNRCAFYDLWIRLMITLEAFP